ncbi:MAG: hypothetical protein DLD55_01855 [candidate division SR1 bacterium]|nr:MAG: hypothetical protein DLD55_01855 [candidate division SR1 bacterium]
MMRGQRFFSGVALVLLSLFLGNMTRATQSSVQNFESFKSSKNGNMLSAPMRDGLLNSLGVFSSSLTTAMTSLNQNVSSLHSKIDALGGGIGGPVVDGSCGTSLRSCSAGAMIKVLDTENCGISKTWLCQGKNRGTTVNCSVKNADCPYFPDTSRITSLIMREERLSYSHKTLYIKPCQGQDCGEEYPIMVDQDYSTMQKFARGETAVAINPQTSYNTVILTACQGKVCKHYHDKRYHSYHSSDMLVAGGKIALGLIPNTYSFKPGTLYVCNGSSCVTYEVQTHASDNLSNKTTTQYVKLYAGEKPLAVIPKNSGTGGDDYIAPTDIVACNGTDCSIYTVSIPSEYLKNISVTKNPDNYTVTYYDAGLQKYQTYTCTGTLCTREGK